MLFAQEKIPVYIFETKQGGFDGASRDNVLQFFADSTFTLTNYCKRHEMSYAGTANKSESKGRYIKIGDTFFLDDATSRFNLFKKEPTEFQTLAKSALLQLFPAKIALLKNGTYFLDATNKSIELKKLQFSSLAKIENFYFPFKPQKQFTN